MVPGPVDWWVLLIVAPFIGSFLSVLVVRLPMGEDVVSSRSQCRSCGKRSATDMGIVLCPLCGETDTTVVSGTELRVLDIEITDHASEDA